MRRPPQVGLPLIWPTLCLSAGLFAQEAPFVTTAWTVQQEASAALARLAQGSDLALPALAQLLDSSGQDLVAAGEGRWIPLCEAAALALEQHGHLAAWQARYAGEAQRALAQLGRGDRAGLYKLCTRFPATPAASQARRWLADLSWDRGLVGDFRALAQPDSSADQARLAALKALETPHYRLPAQWQVLWQIPLETLPGRPHAISGKRIEERVGELGAALIDGQTLVVSNGRHALWLDPVSGTNLGPVQRLGTDALPGHLAQPAVGLGLAVLLGRSGAFHTLTGFDSGGRQQWRTNVDLSGSASLCSAPVLMDGLVIVACVVADAGAASLRVQAFTAQKGLPRWSVQVARLPARAGRELIQVPQLMVSEGRLIVLGGQGCLAELTPSGRLVQVAAYPRQDDDQLARALMPFQSGEKQGRLLVQGRTVIAQPADAPWPVLWELDRAQAPRALNGLGDDLPLALTADGGLVLGGPALRVVDLRGQERWSVFAPDGRPLRWAVVLGEHILAGTEQVALKLEASTGRIVQQQPWKGGQVLMQLEALTLTWNGSTLQALGDRQGVLAAVQAQLTNNPNDPQPHLALAAFAQAQNDLLTALSHLRRALALGGGDGALDRALSLLRPQLRLQAGSAQFADLRQAMRELIPWRASLEPELAWWDGVDLERRNQSAAARERWASIPANGSLRLGGDGGAEWHLGAIAERARRPTSQPQTSPPNLSPPAPQPVADTAWRVQEPGFKALLPAAGRWFRHAGGMLRAYDSASGRTLWSQADSEGGRPMLGLSMRGPDADRPGIPISVLPGSSAYLAGLRDDDRLLSLDEHQLFSGRDVVALVRTLPIGHRFQVRLDRQGTTQALSGVLGSWPEEPVAANAQVLLTRSLALRLGARGDLETSPDTDSEPKLRMYDASTGHLRWEHALSTRQAAWLPLLDGSLLLLADAGSLQAWDIAQQAPQKIWEIPGQGYELAQASVIDGLLVVRDDDHERAVLRRLRDGEVIFSAPRHPNDPLLFDGDLCLLSDHDRHLQAFDLSCGERRWILGEPGHAVLCASASFIFSLDEQLRLSSWHRNNGQLHRRYTEWSRILHSFTANGLLYVLGADQDNRDVLAALELATGNQRWALALPRLLEVEDSLHPLPGGMGAVIAAGEHDRHVLVINADGSVRGTTALNDEEQVQHDGQILLARSDDGLRRLVPTAVGEGSLLRAVVADAGQSPERLVPMLPWQQHGKDRVAAALTADGCWLFWQGEGSRHLRLDRQLGAVSASESLLVVEHDEVQVHTQGDWVAGNLWKGPDHIFGLRITASGGGGPWFWHIEDPGAPEGPWWLRSGWLRLQPSAVTR